MELVTLKALQFPHPRTVVWAAMADVDSYQRWWPWLRAFDARALATGEQWHCTVRPPLPYTVSFTLTFDDVSDEEHALVRVGGDVGGTAHLTLRDTSAGCEVEVRSDLAPQSTFLRFLTSTLPPVARFGHDWILSTGARQFEERALSVGAPDTTT